MELIVVLIVIGILATLGLTHYGSYRERSLGKEAIAHLKLIAAAEKVYRLELGSFYPCDDVNDINASLKLSLNERSWNYQITGDALAFTASATRGACVYTMNQNDEEPAPGANCP